MAIYEEFGDVEMQKPQEKKFVQPNIVETDPEEEGEIHGNINLKLDGVIQLVNHIKEKLAETGDYEDEKSEEGLLTHLNNAIEELTNAGFEAAEVKERATRNQIANR